MSFEFAQKNFEHFSLLKDILFQQLKSDENLTLSLVGENSDFVRWNKGLVRQNTTIEQSQLSMTLTKGPKTQTTSFPFFLDFTELKRRALFQLGFMRETMAQIPDDPFQSLPTMEGSSEQWLTSSTTFEEKVSDIRKLSEGHDMVGILCSGPTLAATANNLGTFHWYCSDRSFLDYSLYNDTKAATSLYAEDEWSISGLERNFKQATHALEILNRPKVEVKPGEYRTFIAAAGVQEVVDTLSWGAFSLSAHRRGLSPFRRLVEGHEKFNSKISIKENFHLGLAPRFNRYGELAPTEIPLVVEGKIENLLTNKKSALEYKVTANGANDNEATRSLDMSGGDLEEKDIISKLDTGLYLSNLHYLNWSDTETARLTGMTRFACFWVEKGEIKGPIQDMRFDESLYSLWGNDLEALTKETRTTPSILSYERRDMNGRRNPGMLVSKMKFTL